MTRKTKLVMNIGAAFTKQVITVICGFVLPRYILKGYGSEVNGLLTSITQFLSFISFLELGVGAVVQSNLYAPLAKRDDEAISRIVVSSEKFFRTLSFIFIGYVAFLILLFPRFVASGFPFFYTVSLIIIIAVSSFAQNYLGVTYQLLLNADQKAFIQMSIQCVTLLINTGVSILFIQKGFSIQLVKLSTAALFLIRPIIQTIYVHHHYNINWKIQFAGEPIQQKWNGFAQHVAAVVVANTDVVVLTFLDTLKNVSVYSVYHSISYGVEQTIMTMSTGLEAMWGNMLANREQERLTASFSFTEWLVHNGISFVFVLTGILIVPFIQIYTQGISDANYILPIFGVILTSAFGMQCLRLPYFLIIKAAGHYKQTQTASIIEMLINVVFSVALVKRFGLNGVAVGTLAAMLYHTCYFAWYLRTRILNRPIRFFCKYLAIDAAYALVCACLTRGFALRELSYLPWVVLALKAGAVCLAVLIAVNCVFYRSTIRKFMQRRKK